MTHDRIDLALQAEHEAVHHTEEAVRDALACFRERPGVETRRALRASFREFDAHLRRHFEYEEQDGLLSEEVAVAPGIEPQRLKLLEEHDQMRADLSHLAHAAENGLEDPAQAGFVTEALDSLFTRLQHHERVENALVMKVHWMDDSAGD